jgi:hypothetical protein
VGRFSLCPADKAAFQFLHTNAAACNGQCKKATATAAKAPQCKLKTGAAGSKCRMRYRSFHNNRFRGQRCTSVSRLYTRDPRYGRCVPKRYYGCNPYKATKEPVSSSLKKRFRASNQFKTLAECKNACCQ